MKRWWHYLLLGVSAWLLFMVWRFPAPVAYSMFVETAGQKLQAAGVDGTLWHGEAAQLQYQQRAVGSLSWQLSPWGLLLGRLGGELALYQGDGYLQAQGKVPLGGDEVSLSTLQGRLPLEMIQPYLTMIPLPLDGVLSLKLKDLLVDAEGRLQQAEGRIVWHQAGVTAPQPLPFGDLQMNIQSSEAGGIEGVISDSGGPLQLSANFTLSAEGAYQLKGQVQAAESAPKELRSSLGMLGKANSQGAYPINFSGSL